MEIVRIDEFIPCHSDVCSQVIRVCRLIWQVFARKIDKRLIASVSPCDLDYRDFLSHLDLSLYFAPLRVWKYKGVFLPLRLNIFRDKQPAWKVRLLACVITVRTSWIDTDFTSEMKLAKLPLIYCFAHFLFPPFLHVDSKMYCIGVVMRLNFTGEITRIYRPSATVPPAGLTVISHGAPPVRVCACEARGSVHS